MADRTKFKHPKTKHETTTGLPVEQTRLRAQGYVEQKSTKAAEPAKPSGK